jgi:hypothetical protein
VAAGSSLPSSEPPFSSASSFDLRWRLTSSFILSVLLGLVFGLSSTTNEAEVKARYVADRSEVVGGATLVMLMHPKASPPPLSPLRWADLNWGFVTMRCGRGA